MVETRSGIKCEIRKCQIHIVVLLTIRLLFLNFRYFKSEVRLNYQLLFRKAALGGTVPLSAALKNLAWSKP